MSKPPPPGYVCDLARKVLAAHHSYALQISLAHAYNHYTKNIPDSEIGALWIDIAEKIIAADMQATRAFLSPLSQAKAPAKDEKA